MLFHTTFHPWALNTQYLYFAAWEVEEWAEKCFAQSNPGDSDSEHIRNPNHDHITVFALMERENFFFFWRNVWELEKNRSTQHQAALHCAPSSCCTPEIKLLASQEQALPSFLHQPLSLTFISLAAKLQPEISVCQYKTNRISSIHLQVKLFWSPGIYSESAF